MHLSVHPLHLLSVGITMLCFHALIESSQITVTLLTVLQRAPWKLHACTPGQTLRLTHGRRLQGELGSEQVCACRLG